MWARHRAKGEGEGGEQTTVHQENAQKTATSKRICFSNVLPHTSNGGRGQRAARERSEGEKSTELPDSTGRGEGGGSTQRVRVAAVMNMWEMLMSADSPTLHRSHGAHTQSKQASERSGNVSRRRRKSPMGECG